MISTSDSEVAGRLRAWNLIDSVQRVVHVLLTFMLKAEFLLIAMQFHVC